MGISGVRQQQRARTRVWGQGQGERVCCIQFFSLRPAALSQSWPASSLVPQSSVLSPRSSFMLRSNFDTMIPL